MSPRGEAFRGSHERSSSVSSSTATPASAGGQVAHGDLGNAGLNLDGVVARVPPGKMPSVAAARTGKDLPPVPKRRRTAVMEEDQGACLAPRLPGEDRKTFSDCLDIAPPTSLGKSAARLLGGEEGFNVHDVAEPVSMGISTPPAVAGRHRRRPRPQDGDGLALGHRRRSRSDA
jgi:hypothetical protein